MSPVWLVFIGLAVILVCILYFKLHAFVSLMLAALVTGLLTTSTQLAGFAQHSGLSADAAKALMSKSLATRLITAFGDAVGKIGILIAFASLIGTALHRSGAAEKIVRTILKFIGSKHTDIALITSSFTLGIPVFFDTVFYLLIPIVKSAGIRNPSKFSLYLMCSIAGGVMTHSLVPPTPGPLFVAKALNVDIGVMIMAGIIIGAITVCAGYAYAHWANKKWELPMRSTPDVSVEELQNYTTLDSKELPSAFFSFLPVILPILLISLNTSLGAAESNKNSGWLALISFIGDSNMALIISALLSLILLRSKVKDGKKFEQYISESISSAAMIILITGAGGSFGQMLQQTDVGGVIGSYAATYKAAILPLAFLITLLVRTAQGSATVAMITAIGVMNGLGDTAQLGFHPVYLAIAIGCGSKIFPWMNDSAFWIITRMSGMETQESIKFFSYLLTIMGFTGLIVVMLAAKFFPWYNMNKVIITHQQDNVAIVVATDGVLPGETIFEDLLLKEWVPMGHKIALHDLNAGDDILRYGYKIGRANCAIPKGSWVKEEMLQMPEAPLLDTIRYQPPAPVPYEPLNGFTFEGYRNPDGTVGTKNILGISMSVHCVAGMADFVIAKIKKELLPLYPYVDDAIAISHTYGCGIAINAPAAIIPIRTIQNLAANPNLGGEILVLGLGCEKLRPETVVGTDRSGNIISMQQENLTGFEAMVEEVMKTAEAHLQKLNARRRETCPVSDLVVGMQCGGSDALSGLTGNPVAGFAADLIVRAGGTVFFSEVTEVRDAIEQLVARAENETVAQRLIEEMRWYDEYLARGEADRSANTTPGNKKGGLSNIVEKALGSVVKSGSMPIVDVIAPGNRIKKKGLQFVATPASDFVCGTLQAAAGMNLHLFITGRGTPYGLNLVPVIKISSNTKLANRWHDLIDFDAGPVALGEKTIETMGWELFHYMLDIASGRKTVATDRLGLYNDLVLFNPGPLT